MKTRSTSTKKSTEQTLNPGDDKVERPLSNPSTAQLSTSRGKRSKTTSKARSSKQSGLPPDENPAKKARGGSNAESLSLSGDGKGSKETLTPLAKPTPRGAPIPPSGRDNPHLDNMSGQVDSSDSEEDEYLATEGPWDRSRVKKRIDEVGRDEFPELGMGAFAPIDEVFEGLTDAESANLTIFDRIRETINKLPMRKGRSLREILMIHRQRKSAVASDIYHTHDAACEAIQGRPDDARCEIRIFAYIADVYGQNPLAGASIPLLAKVIEVFKDQYKFFQGEGDCCENDFFTSAATVACETLKTLIDDYLQAPNHRRALWHTITDDCAEVFEIWEESLNVPETAEEKEERIKEHRLDKKLALLRNRESEIQEKEQYLISHAEKLAAKEIPKNLLAGRDPDDAQVYDHKLRKYRPLRELKMRASKAFQDKLFRDAKRKHNKEKAQAESEQNDKARQEEAARIRAEREANPFDQTRIDRFVKSIKANSKDAPVTKAKTQPSEREESADELSWSESSVEQEDDRADIQDFVDDSFRAPTPELNQVSTPAMTNVMVNMTEVPTMEDFSPGGKSYHKLMKYIRECENKNQLLRIDKWPKKLVSAINFQYRHTFETHLEGNGADEDWQRHNPSELQLTFLRMYEATQGMKTSSTDLTTEFRTWLANYKLRIDWSSATHPMQHPFTEYVNEILYRYDTLETQLKASPLSQSDKSHLVKILAKEVVHENISKEGRTQMKTTIDGALNELKDFRHALTAVSDIVMKQLKTLFDADGFRPEATKRKASYSQSPHGDPEESAKKTKRTKPSFDKKGKSQSPSADRQAKARCKGCGWDLKQKDGKGARRCSRNDFKSCKGDPRRNMTGQQWVDSEVGKKWSKYTKKGLPKDTSITLDNVADRWQTPNKSSGKGINLNQYCAHLLGISHALINFSIVNEQQEATNEEDLEEPPALSGRLLLDTGAIGNSVVSSAFYNKLLKSNQTHKLFTASSSLTSAFNDSANITKEISFKVKIFDLNSSIIVDIKALVADINVDLIIDRRTVKTNNLIMHFPDHFADGDLLDYLKQAPKTSLSSSESAAISEESDWNIVMAFFQNQEANPTLETSWTKQLRNIAAASKPRIAFKQQQRAERKEQRRIHKQLASRWTHLNHIASTHDIVASTSDTVTQHKEEVGDITPKVSQYDTYLASLASNFSRKAAFEREGNLVDIPDNKLESIPAEIINNSVDETEYVKVLIEGPPVLQAKLRKLVQKHKLVFRSNVQATPANLDTFTLDIDDKQWYTKANRLPARNTDSERAKALNEMLEILIKHQVIEPCDDSHYSHAFLVPKPNGKWRLVLDFKNLNKATINYYKWPLPNIKEMLNRIGDCRPKYFAVFDLTSGYYQAPIDEKSRKYTAFTTREGVYSGDDSQWA